MKTFLITLFFVPYFWMPDSGLAAEKHAKILGNKSKSRISELKIKSQKLDVQKNFVILRGGYKKAKWHLVWMSEKISLSESGEFQIQIPFEEDQPILGVALQAVGPFGESEFEELIISIYDDSGDAEVPKNSARQIFMQPEMSFTSISYQETGKADYSALALTAKMSAHREVFSPQWNLGTNVFFTVLPLKKSSNVNARFLGVNLRMGYLFPAIAHWETAIYGGIYYTTMIVSPGAFGFQNMVGLQLLPTLKRSLSGGNSVRAYLKFSPVMGAQSKLISFSNRELAMGGAYSIALSNQHQLSITTDLSLFNLVFSKDTVKVTTFSLGVGYSL